VNGAVRVTFPTSTLDARVRRVWAQVALLCIAVLLAVAAVAYVLARSVTRPVRKLEDATDRFASGDHAVRVEADAGWPELRHLAQTFNRMADRLERLVAVQRRFVADASHQLRTPLTALRLRLENLDAYVAEHDRPAIAAAAAEVTRMSRLVDGLLLLARDDAADITAAPVDVAQVVQERANTWQDVADERGISIDVQSPPSAWALAIPGAVEQLVDNLVDNALAVSPAGARIELRVDATSATVALHVLDEGPGLDPDARVRAFDRFWRAPDAAPGGSGLGLAIVRQLADVSGGSAWLDPRVDGGLDAVVVLPATTAFTSPLPVSR
jgi:signal transduction histidine kinase